MFDELDKLIDSEIFKSHLKINTLELQEGERREVSILFADVTGFTSISEKLDPEQLRTILDKLMQLFTICIKHYGGYVDKYEGDLVMALFGAKIATEQDTERAINAALSMLGKLNKFNELLNENPDFKGLKLNVRIGINTGLVTTGKIGEKREGDFTVYGDAVNLASRMESNAPINSIMIPDGTKKIVENVFTFKDIGEIKIKGKEKTVKVYLVKSINLKHMKFCNVKEDSVFVGREFEMKLLSEKYIKIKTNLLSEKISKNLKQIVVGIKGSAGLGKSRLIYEFLKKKCKNKYVLIGSVPTIVQNPYCVFTSMIREYFKITYDDTNKCKKEKLEEGYREIKLNLTSKEEINIFQDTLPIIGYLIGIKYDDIRLNLNSKELQTYINTSIRYFLEATAEIANNNGYLLTVILEDLHWIDEASSLTMDFLMQTLNLEEKREDRFLKHILFILAYRDEFNISKSIISNTEFEEINLSHLKKESTINLLNSLIGNIKLSNEIKNQLIEKSIGNPFYIEEWVNLIKEIPEIKKNEQIQVPNTLKSLVLSRIDILNQKTKLLLQKASVIGRKFNVDILREIEEKLIKKNEIKLRLEKLEKLDFVYQLFNSQFKSYFFKHIITQEVAYNTLLIANRRILHKIVAEVIEEKFSDNLEEFYYDLAEHYSKAEVKEKSIEYLEKAGNKAKKNYENQKAIEIYDKLLKYLEFNTEELASIEQKQIEKFLDINLNKAEILKLIGNWEFAENIFKNSLNIAINSNNKYYIAKTRQAFGSFLLDKGDYESAMDNFNIALKLYNKANDKRGYAITISDIGVVYAFKGNYKEALKSFHEQKKISEELKEKKLISKAIGNIGNVYLFQGKYQEALEYYYKELKVSELLRDKKSISRIYSNLGIVYRNLGNYNKSMEFYKKNLKLVEEFGFKNAISRTIGNMGILYYKKGNNLKAMEFYQKKLKIDTELGDEKGISIVTGNIGLIYSDSDDFKKAENYFEKAINISRKQKNKLQLCSLLLNLVDLYIKKFEYKRAQKVNNKAIMLSKEIGNKEIIFNSQLNSSIIKFNIASSDEDKYKIIIKMNNLLINLEDDKKIAKLNYSLWKMIDSFSNDFLKKQKIIKDKEFYGIITLEIYKKLYKKTLDIEFKNFVKELEVVIS